MNSLSKLQILMVAFLLLVLAAFLVDPLLLILAVALFLMQIPISRRDLRAEYPEDWQKYTAVFMIYELILLVIFYVMATTRLSFTDLSSIYNLLTLIIVVIVMVIGLKYLAGRRHCYGTVLFSTKGWVGVEIKNDLLSKAREGNYAVENPMNVKVAKGDRVRVRIGGGLGKTIPTELIGLEK